MHTYSYDQLEERAQAACAPLPVNIPMLYQIILKIYPAKNKQYTLYSFCQQF